MSLPEPVVLTVLDIASTWLWGPQQSALYRLAEQCLGPWVLVPNVDR